MAERQQYLMPYDLPVPPKVDWAKLPEGTTTWVQAIAEAAR